MVNLYDALCDIEGRRASFVTPADVLAQARTGDAMALAAVERFWRILGATAGDFALAYGATGGVLLAGGVAPRMREVLTSGGFRGAFEAKGRFAPYLSAIPTNLVVNPYLALLGAAARLRSS